jgi:NAD(P)H-hydrate epimerase
MKVLSVSQIRELDAYTIANEPVSSFDLMERAGCACADWILDHFSEVRNAFILCGTGNNGGDGLVIARILGLAGWNITIAYPAYTNQSPDFIQNFKAVVEADSMTLVALAKGDDLPKVSLECIAIDALFGSGLNKNIEGHFAAWIKRLNTLQNLVISIDIPSGLFADQPSTGLVVHADFTLSFEVPKLAFLIPENAPFVGEWVVLPIGLDADKLSELATLWHLLEVEGIIDLVRIRGKFDHKGTFGHALLIAGSYGKAGAAILAGKAALRAGAGLVTLHLPASLNPIAQSTFPEAMVATDEHSYIFTGTTALSDYVAIGIGCGIGQAAETKTGLQKVLKDTSAGLILDADALNLIASDTELLAQIPPGTILTPHLKEFERLFGQSENHFDRLEKLRNASVRHQITIVLKGAHSAIATPDGIVYFNTTGNPGMATAGSGDVLTGIITGLRAQGFSAEDAAKLGVFLHGLAGDLAAEELGEEALIASDIISNIGHAYQLLHKLNQEA